MEIKTNASSKLTIRFLAILIDFALIFLVFLGAYELIFKNVFSTQEEENLVASAQVYSGLLIKDEDGYYHQLNTDDYQKYQDIVETYYLTDKYFGSEFYLNNNGTRNAYSILEYNEKILEIGKDYSFFEYQYDENDNINKEILGTYKKDLYVDRDKTKGLSEAGKAELLSFYSRHYKNLFTDLYKDDFYYNARKEVTTKGAYAIVSSSLLAYSLVYIIPPLTNKYGYTLGRFLTRIAIIHKDDYFAKRYMFLLRNVFMVIILLVPLIKDDLFIYATVIAIYLLTNWLISIMNRSNYSLLDYISLTKSVNVKTATIYQNKEEMEAYEGSDDTN